jgi:hypothetical protein
MALGLEAGYGLTTLTTLTAVGVSDAVITAGVHLCFQVTLSSVGTNVVVRFEGSLDGNSYFNLAPSAVDYTLTANGTYGYVLYAPVQYVRVRLVSISGGTPSVATVIGTY